MSFIWSENFALGCGPMDATHREFVEIVGRLREADNEELPSRLDELLAHTEAHFSQEDAWMAETAFPPIHCHTGEHANVLDVIREVRRRVLAGDLEVARVLARELSPWFANHAATMDTALAKHMRDVGFKPVANASKKAA